jgi:hypothetical protein
VDGLAESMMGAINAAAASPRATMMKDGCRFMMGRNLNEQDRLPKAVCLRFGYLNSIPTYQKSNMVEHLLLYLFKYGLKQG